MSNPNNPVLVDEGVRTRVTHNEEHYYYYTSDSAMCVTVPRENQDKMSGERQYLEEMCRSYTKARGGEPV